ncbi:MAG: adenylate/guanylate cyclase domain-containing protein [Proteobacteria bacterium]|nr:adenylate/guanylate cyclase domain-containing protein [Pseudomonadota bacterium]
MPQADSVARFVPYRASAYLCMAVIIALSPAIHGVAKLLMALFCCAWPLWVVWRGGASVLRLQLFEAVLTGGLFLLFATPLFPTLAMIALILISNAALGGPQLAAYAGLALSLGGGFGAGIAWLSGLPADLPSGYLPVAVPPTFSDALSGLLVIAYALVIACVAQTRVVRVSGLRRDITAMNERYQRYLPQGLIERVTTNPAARCQLERRWLSIAFIDLVAFSQMLESLSAEESVVVLNDTITAFSNAAVAQQAQVVKLLGDGVLLGFDGSEDRHDALARAIISCTMVRSDVQTSAQHWQQTGLPVTVELRAGIASGYCSIGDWGGADKLDFNVIGVAVNRASRLKEAASPGATLICRRSIGLAEVAFEVEPLGELHLKGLGLEPVWRVVDRDRASGKVPAASARK